MVGQSGDRIPKEARFSLPVHIGPEANAASCTMGTGSFPEEKRPERGATSLLLLVPGGEWVRAINPPALCAYTGMSRGDMPFILWGNN